MGKTANGPIQPGNEPKQAETVIRQGRLAGERASRPAGRLKEESMGSPRLAVLCPSLTLSPSNLRPYLPAIVSLFLHSLYPDTVTHTPSPSGGERELSSANQPRLRSPLPPVLNHGHLTTSVVLITIVAWEDNRDLNCPSNRPTDLSGQPPFLRPYNHRFTLHYSLLSSQNAMLFPIYAMLQRSS